MKSLADLIAPPVVGQRIWVTNDRDGGAWKEVVDVIPMVDVIFADGTRTILPADVDSMRRANAATRRWLTGSEA